MFAGLFQVFADQITYVLVLMTLQPSSVDGGWFC